MIGMQDAIYTPESSALHEWWRLRRGIMQPVDSNDPTVPLSAERPAMPEIPYGQHVYPVEPARSSQPVAPRPRYTPAPDPVDRQYRAAQIVYLVLGIIEILLLLRLVLELLAANPYAAFSSLIYGITAPLVAPFQGVFPNSIQRGNVFDLAAVLAMIVWALLAWVIERVITIMMRRQPPLSS